MDDFDMLSAPQGSAGNGVGAEEDPAAAFLAQQESEIAGIENDEGFSILDSGDVPSSLSQDLDGGFTPPIGPFTRNRGRITCVNVIIDQIKW